MFYPIERIPQPEGGFVSKARDIPEMITQGDTSEELDDNESDALLTAFTFYVENWKVIPAPSKGLPADEMVAISMHVRAAILALNTLIENGVMKEDVHFFLRQGGYQGGSVENFFSFISDDMAPIEDLEALIEFFCGKKFVLAAAPIED